MAADAVCPAPRDYQQLLQGQLSAEQGEPLVRHLEGCDQCAAVLERWLSRETPGSAGRRTADGTPARSRQEIVQAVRRKLGNPRATARPSAPPEEAEVELEEEAPVTLPEQFGRYRILKKLGRGGMGTVYLALDTQLDRRVALKVPHLGRGGPRLERFLREARAAATLHHPNICAVFDVGEQDGIHYLTMALIEGRPLTAFIRPDRLMAPHVAAVLVRKLALALQEAHARGIIHRDLKPSNIMIDTRKEPVVMDFGLAGRTDSTDARLTRSGAIMGTPAYMPPEQVMGNLQAMGPASDVYSLGVILYELLTARVPFEGPTAMVLGSILYAETERPTQRRPDLDPGLETVCLKAMAKRVEDRYASMTEFAAALLPYCKPRATTVAEDQPAPELAAPAFPDLTFVGAASASGSSEAAAPSARRTRRPLLWLLAAGGAALVLLLAVVLFVRTGEGTIEIELLEARPHLEVRIDGEVVTLDPQGPTPLRLRAGKHELVVSGKDFETVTREFVVKRGQNPVLRLRPGREEVAAVKPPEPPPAVAIAPAPVVPPPAVPATPAPAPQPAAAPPSPMVSTPAPAAAAAEGLRQLEWEGLPLWRWENGDLVGSSAPSGITFNTCLCSKRTYTDFELSFKVRLKDGLGNSGVQFRSRVVDPEKKIVAGPQADIGSRYWGSLYDERGAGMLREADQQAVDKVLRPRDFNDYLIRCVGKRVRIQINGVTAVDEEFAMLPADGIIAFQIHSGPAMEVAFRDIRLQEITAGPASGWMDLFNGKDLASWVGRNNGPAGWKVADGYLEVVPGQGNIMTRGNYGPAFELHAEFWVPRSPGKMGQGRGNSGIYLQGRHEIQIVDSYMNPDIRPEQACGALYNEAAPARSAARPPEQWQTFDITFRAPEVDGQGTVTRPGRVSVVHNGIPVLDQAEIRQPSALSLDKRLGLPGPIMLQDHGSPVRFRNLRIRPLPAEAPDPAPVRPAPAAPRAPQPVSLFNGKDLSGWTVWQSLGPKEEVQQPGKGGWIVKNGELLCMSSTPGWLRSPGTYGDFVLQLEVKLPPGGNSGVFIRCPGQGHLSDTGMEVQLVDETSPRSPRLTAPNRSGALVRVTGPATSALRPLGTWNELEIRCEGNRVEVTLNGKQTAQADMSQVAELRTRPRTGYIGLSNWRGEAKGVAFRNIRITDLAKSK